MNVYLLRVKFENGCRHLLASYNPNEPWISITTRRECRGVLNSKIEYEKSGDAYNIS